ncbi:hypothetical protein KIN20_004603 [Parelaphostrongylus tenuis]|uniref:Uncharacterized protein n=1 Tax=Parelaphostrongylus tenuis TaxID=148309 RepID=A0AAD5MH87_PARTN|nr:hypothetical protein KIN20_004603 [Parelaphostrongylus tenuis]
MEELMNLRQGNEPEDVLTVKMDPLFLFSHSTLRKSLPSCRGCFHQIKRGK